MTVTVPRRMAVATPTTLLSPRSRGGFLDTHGEYMSTLLGDYWRLASAYGVKVG